MKDLPNPKPPPDPWSIDPKDHQVDRTIDRAPVRYDWAAIAKAFGVAL